MTSPDRYCECGCGQKTNRAQTTSRKFGWIEGEPLRFIHGHNQRGNYKPPEYTIEDRGYETPCWVWQRATNGKGYGQMHNKKLAHRVFYEGAKGPIPDGLQIDHLCMVRACVNPDHLEAVTHSENLLRGFEARRQRRAA